MWIVKEKSAVNFDPTWIWIWWIKKCKKKNHLDIYLDWQKEPSHTILYIERISQNTTEYHRYNIIVIFSFSCSITYLFTYLSTYSQTVLCGMGELHIEIIHDRIKREYNIETHLGPLQVAYRETIIHSATASGKANANCLLIIITC